MSHHSLVQGGEAQLTPVHTRGERPTTTARRAKISALEIYIYCVGVGVRGLQIYYIICSARADKTHSYRLCYGVTETGLVGAAVGVPE